MRHCHVQFNILSVDREHKSRVTLSSNQLVKVLNFGIDGCTHFGQLLLDDVIDETSSQVDQFLQERALHGNGHVFDIKGTRIYQFPVHLVVTRRLKSEVDGSPIEFKFGCIKRNEVEALERSIQQDRTLNAIHVDVHLVRAFQVLELDVLEATDGVDVNTIQV